MVETGEELRRVQEPRSSSTVALRRAGFLDSRRHRGARLTRGTLVDDPFPEWPSARTGCDGAAVGVWPLATIARWAWRHRRVWTAKSSTGRKSSISSSATMGPPRTGTAIGQITSAPTPVAQSIGAIKTIIAPAVSNSGRCAVLSSPGSPEAPTS